MDIAVNAASVAIVKDGRVLLIQRARAPFLGRWTLPGGRCEPGESAASAAKREMREELGLVIARPEPLTVLDPTPDWRLAVFATGAFSGDVVPSAEVAAWRWCSAEDAAALPTTPGLDDVLRLALQSDRPIR